jgi:hypothetical protein
VGREKYMLIQFDFSCDLNVASIRNGYILDHKKEIVKSSKMEERAHDLICLLDTVIGTLVKEIKEYHSIYNEATIYGIKVNQNVNETWIKNIDTQYKTHRTLAYNFKKSVNDSVLYALSANNIKEIVAEFEEASIKIITFTNHIEKNIKDIIKIKKQIKEELMMGKFIKILEL